MKKINQKVICSKSVFKISTIHMHEHVHALKPEMSTGPFSVILPAKFLTRPADYEQKSDPTRPDNL